MQTTHLDLRFLHRSIARSLALSRFLCRCTLECGVTLHSSEDPGGGGTVFNGEGGTSEREEAGSEKDFSNAQKSCAPSVELFDSTALFHWCRPRSYETVILVREFSQSICPQR